MLAGPIGRLAVALTRYAYRHGHHAYLSTSCLHGNHAYCQTQARRYDGSVKVASTCKFCSENDNRDGACICRCHRKNPHP